MNIIIKKMKVLLGVIIVMLVATNCSESLLEPEPKSFFSPQNTLIDKAGFESVLLSNRKLIASQHLDDNTSASILLTEYYNTDIAIAGNHQPEFLKDFPRDLLPTTTGRLQFFNYWEMAYEGISNANIVLSNIENENVNWSSDEEKNATEASALFYRSYWYYRIVNQFGDVPLVVQEVEGAKLDFNTFKREAILQQIVQDMEFAVEWLPQERIGGMENRAAGYHLLTKIYLQLQQFQDAVDAASAVINDPAYSLMTDRFGSGRYADNSEFNVVWDLFEKENISSQQNTEWIFTAQGKFGIDGNTSENGSGFMRLYSPLWWWPPVRDPNGERGAVDGPEGNPFSDSLGRGIGQMRTNNFFNYSLYSDPNDLRVSDVNWFSRDEFYYNNPNSEFYGQPFSEAFVSDTIRTWYAFPYNKIYVPDESTEHRKQGGYTDWYIYRLAETYLLRAEAYYWLGNNAEAAADINAIRERSDASIIGAGEVSLDYIFDERARELYLEEMRKTELTRVAYIMAQLGRDGYSLENMNNDNWWYDRILDKNSFISGEVSYGGATYRIEPYNVYWPVPQDAIDANQFGTINQNKGYTGAANNVPPLGLEDL